MPEIDKLHRTSVLVKIGLECDILVQNKKESQGIHGRESINYLRCLQQENTVSMGKSLEEGSQQTMNHGQELGQNNNGVRNIQIDHDAVSAAFSDHAHCISLGCSTLTLVSSSITSVLR